MDDTVVKLSNITKTFPGVVALNNVSLKLKKGEIRGLVGENGAGKSTLIKVLTGVYIPESGTICINGDTVCFHNPNEAIRHKIACVYQEINLVQELSITDNIFLGNYITTKSGFLDYKAMNQKASEIMVSLNQRVDTGKLCGTLGMGMRQMVEIAKAILQNAEVIVFDEPTASLGEQEIKDLFRTIRQLKENGVSIVYVSHKLEEVLDLCDTVTVMRDAKHIITTEIGNVTKESLITYMVGRTLDTLYPKSKTERGECMLELKNFSRLGSYHDVNLRAYAGEVLGLYGLVGAGRTEVFRGVFGIDPIDGGEIYIRGRLKSITCPGDAIRERIAFITEDRKAQGLILNASVSWNLTLASIDSLKKGIFLDEDGIKKQANDSCDKLRIKTSSLEQLAGKLSGGNQQKVVVGKWLSTNSNVFIFDEPTRGIDVRAKIEIYNIINELTADGNCVIMVSSELPEIMGLSDRMIVMHNGGIVMEMNRSEYDQEAILIAALGG